MPLLSLCVLSVSPLPYWDRGARGQGVSQSLDHSMCTSTNTQSRLLPVVFGGLSWDTVPNAAHMMVSFVSLLFWKQLARQDWGPLKGTAVSAQKSPQESKTEMKLVEETKENSVSLKSGHWFFLQANQRFFAYLTTQYLYLASSLALLLESLYTTCIPQCCQMHLPEGEREEYWAERKLKPV